MASECDKVTLSAYLYNGQGTSSPIIPLHLVENGAITRFTNPSPTDFIVANRFMANAQWLHKWGNEALTQGNIYGYRYTLGLTENPSGFTSGPMGDQIDQIDERWVAGLNLAHTWKSILLGECVSNTLGVQVRHDNIPHVQVFATEERVPFATIHDSDLHETDTGLYYQNEVRWTDKVRTVLGLRGEWYSTDVTNHVVPENSGGKFSKMFLPKGSLILGPFEHTEVYLNGGYSFHSNNAEGAIGTVDSSGNPVQPVPLLVQARGAEVGVRSQAIPDLTTSVALWQMHLQSELIFDPVAETTIPQPSSDRYGIEWINTYRICSWLTLDADYSWSHGRFLNFDPTMQGKHIPDAVMTTFVAGPSVRLPNGLFANLRYRYWGPRFLADDPGSGIQSSRATNLFELATGYECQRYTFNLSIINLFNSNGHDIDFYTSSFYPNFGDTVNPTNDIHFKPLMPFSVRASYTLRW
jgi:outer membrane receptor protein involved in Fe transport